jgi:hypothetical protein
VKNVQYSAPFTRPGEVLINPRSTASITDVVWCCLAARAAARITLADSLSSASVPLVKSDADDDPPPPDTVAHV